MVTALAFPLCPQTILMKENPREENIRNNVSYTRLCSVIVRVNILSGLTI